MLLGFLEQRREVFIQRTVTYSYPDDKRASSLKIFQDRTNFVNVNSIANNLKATKGVTILLASIIYGSFTTIQLLVLREVINIDETQYQLSIDGTLFDIFDISSDNQIQCQSLNTDCYKFINMSDIGNYEIHIK